MDSQRTLAGRYHLKAHIARGGMADVFEGEDVLLSRRVAVKVLHSQFSGDRAFVERFRREAQAAANLSHPNIVSIYDWGEDEGTYFMVMELIEGRTLRDILRSEGALLPRRGVEIAVEATAALSVAHRAGLSHRDVKPGNIMLTRDGSVKVTDFGIARAIDESDELTRTGAVIGTASYFSPEQARGEPADSRSDIYSLGVVLYELLVGHPPFSGDSPVAVAYQHVSENPPLPSHVNPDVTPDLESIVMKALAKDADDRYQTADELRADLVRYLRGEVPAAAPVAVAATQTMEQPPPATVPPDETARHVAYVAEEERPPSQPLFIFGIVGLVAALGIGTFLLLQLISGPSPTDLVEVPELSGQQSTEAFDILIGLDLRPRLSNQPSTDVEAGMVIATDPPGGQPVDPESVITVFVSAGPETFPVPRLVDLSLDQARSLIEEQGFVIGGVIYQPSQDVIEGTVLIQSPTSGTPAAPGAAVDLVVSTGPDAITVPNLTGLTERNALFQLIQSGFTADAEHVLVEEEFNSDLLAGFVIRSEPMAGALLPTDGIIRLIVSKGPEPVAVPSLVGLSIEAARVAVEGLELEFVLDPETVLVTAESGLDGLVAAQQPAAGVEIPTGSAVFVQLGEVPLVTVPSVVGMTEANAQAALEAAGLIMTVGGTEEVPPEQAGTILSQSPLAGSLVEPGSGVTVIIGIPMPTTTTTTTTTLPPTTTVPPTTVPPEE